MTKYKTSQELRANLVATEYFLIQRSGNARLSSPVPARDAGRASERFFITDMTGLEAGASVVPRPYAWFAIDAETGNMLFYHSCQEMDFLDARVFPEGCRVSNQVGFSGKEEYQEACERMKELYEKLRLLFWQGKTQGFTPEETAAREEYTKLFAKAIRIGQQAFYQALAPEFFQWLGVGGAVVPQQQEEDLREALNRLTRLFETKIQTDAHKEKLFDNMHRELISFRNGVNNKPLISMAMDIITMIDGLDKAYKALSAKEDESQRLKGAMNMLQDNRQELEDILYRASFEPYSCPGDIVDTKRQRIISYEKTDDPQKVNHIAARLGDGYEFEGQIIRHERIKIYKQN